jgi:hypothetical protein
VPLGQKGDWVVMAARLVQLRAAAAATMGFSGPAGCRGRGGSGPRSPARAAGDQALAGWLERRLQLGHDLFARGRPEVFGASVDAAKAMDVIDSCGPA